MKSTTRRLAIRLTTCCVMCGAPQGAPAQSPTPQATRVLIAPTLAPTPPRRLGAEPVQRIHRVLNPPTAVPPPLPPLDERGLPPGYTIVDGDIMVRIDADGGVATNWDEDVWPGGIVPVFFDDNVDQAQRIFAADAMARWEQVANVAFLEYGGQGDYIHIRDSSEHTCPDACPGNSSAVGRQGGSQILNYTSWNSTYSLVHELGHALGFHHEQQRDDRNAYVALNLANSSLNEEEREENFGLLGEAEPYGPYDFDSIMHYGRCDFAANSDQCSSQCPNPAFEVIRVLPPYDAEWQCSNPVQGDRTKIGQRSHVSFWDGKTMSFLYPWPNWRFQRNSTGDDSGPGSFIFPYRTFREGVEDTPPGGRLIVLEPSGHGLDYVLNKPMTIEAPLGGVVLNR